MQSEFREQILPAAIFKLHGQGYLPPSIAKLLRCTEQEVRTVLTTYRLRPQISQKPVARIDPATTARKETPNRRDERKRRRFQEQERRTLERQRLELEKQEIKRQRADEAAIKREAIRKSLEDLKASKKEVERQLAWARRTEQALAKSKAREDKIRARDEAREQRREAKRQANEACRLQEIQLRIAKQEAKPVLPRTTPPCIYCKSPFTNKNGFADGSKQQRYICRECSRTFLDGVVQYAYRNHKPYLNHQVLIGTLEGKTREVLARELRCGEETVGAKQRVMAEYAKRDHEARVQASCHDTSGWLYVLPTNVEVVSSGCHFLYVVVGAQTGDILEFNFASASTQRYRDTLADLARMSFPGLSITETPPDSEVARQTVEELFTLCDKVIRRVKTIPGAGSRMYLWLALRRGLINPSDSTC